MLTEAKNQVKVMALSLKYNIMKQMVNKVTFITNILFMILNNSTFIIQWIILFNLKDEIGGYTLKEIILLWGMAAGTFSIAHIFFQKSFELSDLIINGKLDTFLVQPKNVLLSVISSETSISAIGDFIYGYICLFIYGCTIVNFILFTCFIVLGGIVLTAFTCMIHSFSFWIVKGDVIADSLTASMINFATYPGSIFKEVIRIIFYTVIPVGIANYLPVETIINFKLINVGYIIGFAAVIVFLAFLTFNRGLKRYSSSNLMSSRV